MDILYIDRTDKVPYNHTHLFLNLRSLHQMFTEAQILKALNEVIDPELNRSIVELGMVTNLTTTDGAVAFTLRLTTLACPLRERLASEAKQAILALDPSIQVDIEIAEMTREQRQRLLEQFHPQDDQPLAAHLNNINTVIAVMSGKGGVGKSSVAAMLAVTLRARGHKVGILDTLLERVPAEKCQPAFGT